MGGKVCYHPPPGVPTPALPGVRTMAILVKDCDALAIVARHPAARCTPIATQTQAKRQPQTQVEYDAPVLAIRKAVGNGKGTEELYDVAEFPTGWEGRAFHLTKDRTGEEYDVFVARNGQDNLCSCIGFESRGVCKHHDALRSL